MKVKILIGILLFLIVVNLATIGTYLYLSFARHGQRGPGGDSFPPGGPMRDPMTQLTQDQRSKIFELMHGFHEEARVLNDSARILEEATFGMLHHDPLPGDSIEAVLRRIADLRLEISRKATQKLIASREFLTTEQQQRLFDAIRQARPEFDGPPMRGDGMPPPGFPPPGDRGPGRDHEPGRRH